MNKPFFLVTCAAWTALVASRVIAQQSSAIEALEQRFKQLDKNGDGKITTDELPQSTFFKQRDRNGDGVITLAEVKAAFEAEAATPASPTPASAAPAKPNAPPPNVGNASAGKWGPGKGRDRSATASLKKSPQLLKPGEHGVGRMIADASFTDIAGTKQRLSSLAKRGPIVIAMTSTSCPVSKKYLPTLASLISANSQQPITWILLNPIATDRKADIEAAAKSIEGNVIYVHDKEGLLTKSLGTQTTTDTLVLDGARTVIFHGAIDDQYGLGYSLDAPTRSYLADALEAMLAGKQPLVAATSAPGCALDSGAKSSEVAVTYHNRISRIVQRNCIECHRDGGVAPFSLASHEDLTAHAGMIREVVEAGTMPPWFARASEGQPEAKIPSLWANDRSLANADKSDLLAWVGGGQQAGDHRDAPEPHARTNDWAIGKPDAVFTFPEPVPIKASGTIPYQNVIVETNLDEDKWIQAIEIRPGDRSVVHHMMVYLLAPDKEGATTQEEAADERAGFWAIYVPGSAVLAYPEGFAKPLPRGVKLRCQVHYTPSGTDTSDVSQVGVIFAKQPPRYEVRAIGIGNPKMAIPPGAENHREEGSLRLPLDIQVLSFLPHMHVRAKACRYRVVTASGETRTLLDIPRYDFNWQLIYRYAEPQAISRGDTIKFTAWYDNSKNNPANPDPTQTVRWGRQTADEMHLGYVEYFVPGLAPGEPLPTFSIPR